MKELKKMISIVIVLVFCVSVMNVYAATVGQSLTSAEAGWQRIDASISPLVDYSGTWAINTINNCYIGNTSRFSTTIGDNIKFKFRGTKLRIVSYRHDTYSNNIEIDIDGNKEIYSQKGTAGPFILFYEKTGLSNDSHTVKITMKSSGYIDFDAIDIDSTGSLLPYSQTNNLQATPGDSKVTLSWDAVPDATGYKVKWGTTPGNYTNTQTVSNSVYSGYDVTGLTNGITYYFTVSAIVEGVDKETATEVSATPTAPAQPSGGPALLVITLTNGTEKEYEMTGSEITAFIDWYNGRAGGSGTPYYVIDKNYNKGPFTSRKDYIVFDKILNFEVMEYEQ